MVFFPLYDRSCNSCTVCRSVKKTILIHIPKVKQCPVVDAHVDLTSTQNITIQLLYNRIDAVNICMLASNVKCGKYWVQVPVGSNQRL